MNKPKVGRRRNTTPEIDKEIEEMYNQECTRTSSQIAGISKEKNPNVKIADCTVRTDRTCTLSDCEGCMEYNYAPDKLEILIDRLPGSCKP